MGKCSGTRRASRGPGSGSSGSSRGSGPSDCAGDAATIVSDPMLIELRDALQAAMGCHQRVEIREVPDLTAPATAGWRHPVILLPVDWRSWDDTDRRAVLAHELAHVQRWDYAAGLVAQLALALRVLSPARALDGAAASVATRAGGGRNRGPVRGRARIVPALSFAIGTQTRWTVSVLAGEGVPPGTRDPDQEDRHVAE